jgi:hypothetical protein
VGKEAYLRLLCLCENFQGFEQDPALLHPVAWLPDSMPEGKTDGDGPGKTARFR